MPHITQIAAKESGSEKTFNIYVMPTVPISFEAQQITGILKTGQTTISVHGEPVESIKIISALEKFLKWLQKCHYVILVAHNGRRFDFPVLISALMKLDINRLFATVCGFIDFLAVFRKIYPGRSNYKQANLVKDILQTS